MGVSKPLSCWILFLHLIFLILINSNGVEASHQILEGLENLAMKTVDPLHRTAFHFQPPRHWINDPNGPMFYMGLYHLFYQYNPYGNVWGNIIWAHSVSTDMVNWEALEPAIYPSKPWDIKGTWSGSATVFLGQGPVIFYTGVTENMTQVQNYAVPEDPADPYLRKWIKPEDNPLIVPDQGVNGSSFRDPTTAWRSKDGHWRVVVGSRRKHRGLVYIYRSRDFRTWVKAKHPLHSKAALGMWECPDFFPVSLTSRNGLEYGFTGPNVKHVLKVSLDMKRYEYYTLGTYDTKIDRYFPDNTSVDSWDGLRFDYGNFYASKTFFDPKKDRRILWGWANESDTLTNDVAKGWAGIQLVPRTVLLDPNGKQLLFWPIEEIETLRAENVQMNNKKLQFGERVEVQGITAYQADVEVTFSIPSLEKAEPFDPSWIRGMDLCAIKGTNVTGGVGPFGLITLATDDFEEYTPVFFRVFKDQQNNKPKVLMCSDARNSSLLKDIWTEKGWDRMYKPSFGGFVDADLEDGRISLRSLVDHSVVESFAAKGKTAITSRVYPTKAVAGNSHLYVFNYGAEPITIESLSAWSMMRPRNMNSD